MYELHIDVAQLVHVGLNGVCKVDQEVGSVFIHATCDIETHCGDESDRSTLNELLCEGQLVIVLTCVNQKLFQSHLTTNLLNTLKRFE